jgi:hypothetical protein
MVGGGRVAADHGVPDVRFCIGAPQEGKIMRDLARQSEGSETATQEGDAISDRRRKGSGTAVMRELIRVLLLLYTSVDPIRRGSKAATRVLRGDARSRSIWYLLQGRTILLACNQRPIRQGSGQKKARPARRPDRRVLRRCVSGRLRRRLGFAGGTGGGRIVQRRVARVEAVLRAIPCREIDIARA